MIFIDYREKKSGIIELFKDSGIAYKIENLKFGDYLIDNKLAIERKTAEDFVEDVLAAGLDYVNYK